MTTGSPPRVRGKAFGGSGIYAQCGITPACAGKSLFDVLHTNQCQDHPRVCGEKLAMLDEIYHAMGSPPRVRGKVLPLLVLLPVVGITPACAGKRFACALWPCIAWDHPRVCGEKRLEIISMHLVRGSPPRVRGKGTLAVQDEPQFRITPACAGKRLKRFHSIGHFSCILCLFHSVLHRASVSGGSRAGPCAPPCLPAQNAVPV